MKRFWMPLFTSIANMAVAAILITTSAAKAEMEYGVEFGPFLPSRISGVREVLNGMGGHAGTSTSKGFFEVNYFGAHGDGIDYHTLGFDYRMDPFGKDRTKDSSRDMFVHFILGFHADYFKPATTSEFRQSGGWHYGGGVRLPLGGAKSPFLLRADFKQRFGPGQSLIVLVGVIFTTGAGATETP